ncbi:3',5'-cyclic-nucleotide phosphodiesterase [[Candida] zeylanoides]
MFDLTFLGASGGPVESATSAILLKSSALDYSSIIRDGLRNEVLSIDAGSGMHSLSEIIYNERMHKSSHPLSAHLYARALEVQECVQPDLLVAPFQSMSPQEDSSPFSLAITIFNLVNNYLITHPHLDHIAGLVINSAGYKDGIRKAVHGCPSTVTALQDHIFNGVIWPNMPSFDIIRLQPHYFEDKFSIGDNFEVASFGLSHGRVKNGLCPAMNCNRRPSRFQTDQPIVPLARCADAAASTTQNYESTAYLITYTPEARSVLIFGDFESDLVSQAGHNLLVWQSVAPLVVSNTLAAVVLECSTNASPSPTTEHYGHLMPLHLILELKQLERQCLELAPAKPHPLNGFNVIVNHVKESVDGIEDPRRAILDTLQRLDAEHRLGLRFSIALGGLTLRV